MLVIVSTVFSILGLCFLLFDRNNIATSCYVLALMLLAISHPRLKEMQQLEDIRVKIEECQKPLPRDQICVIELKAVPQVKEQGD
jgi:hypothetical protein